MSHPHSPDPARAPVLDRRQFITAALGLVAGTLLPAGRLAADAGAGNLVGMLADPAAAARVGRAYLDAVPAEADADLLVEHLVDSLRARGGALPSDPEALRPALADLVQDEYITAELVAVDGWPLAPSEARLYALAALAGGG
jgi:hypothetical protein